MSTPTHKKISISPCHEDWNKMHPNSNGRFCDSCAKNVIDFTTKSDQEVINYLSQQDNSETCGRFLKTQIHTIRIPFDKELFSTKLQSWQRFLIIFMFCFGQELFNIEFIFAQEIPTDTTIVTTEQDSLFLGSTVLTIENPDTLVIDTNLSVVEVQELDSITKLNIICIAGITMGSMYIEPVIYGDISYSVPTSITPILSLNEDYKDTLKEQKENEIHYQTKNSNPPKKKDKKPSENKENAIIPEKTRIRRGKK